MAVANWASGVGGARTIDPASRETRGDGEAAPGAMREDPAVVWAAASPLAASAGWSAVSQVRLEWSRGPIMCRTNRCNNINRVDGMSSVSSTLIDTE